VEAELADHLTCSPENVERFIGPVLSGRTVEAVIFL
jgi:hypothetical protein